MSSAQSSSSDPFETLSRYRFEANPEECWRAWQLVEASALRVWQGEQGTVPIFDAQHLLVHCGGRDGNGVMLRGLTETLLKQLLLELATDICRAKAFKPVLRRGCRQTAVLLQFLMVSFVDLEALHPGSVHTLVIRELYNALCCEPGVGLAAATALSACVALVPGAGGRCEITTERATRVHDNLAAETFVGITGADSATAARLLARCHNELDAAVALFFEAPPSPPCPGRSEEPPESVTRAVGLETLCQANGDATPGTLPLPDLLLARVLAMLPSPLLTRVTATCRQLRQLLPEATNARATYLGVNLRHGDWPDLVCLDSQGNLRWLRFPSGAWRCTWPLRLIEALAVTASAALWEQPGLYTSDLRDGGWAFFCAYGGARGVGREVQDSLLDRADATDVVLRAVLHARARRILQNLIGNDTELARCMARKGALGPQPALTLRPGMSHIVLG